MTEKMTETKTQMEPQAQTPMRPESEDVPRPKPSRFTTVVKIKLITALVLLVLGAIVAFQNRRPVELELYFWSVAVRLTWLLVFTLLVGVLCGMLLSMTIRRKKHH